MFFALALENKVRAHASAQLPTTKVRVLHRVAAKMVDIALIMGVSAIFPYPLGPIAGFCYSLTGDAMSFKGFRSQSVGKRLLKLRVISTQRKGEPANLRDSLLRNAPVGVATFFAIIPVWGWLILGLIGLPLMLMEIYLMLSVGTGHRLGDVMADTEVIQDGHAPNWNDGSFGSPRGGQ